MRSYIKAQFAFSIVRQLLAIQNIRPILLHNRIMDALALHLFTVTSASLHRFLNLVSAQRKERRTNQESHLARALTVAHVEDRCQFIKLQKEEEEKFREKFEFMLK